LRLFVWPSRIVSAAIGANQTERKDEYNAPASHRESGKRSLSLILLSNLC
jgi:hypothetical protein